jgi:hypothetical protein
MDVSLDLTVLVAEILDAVIFMDKSPAYAAFKEEIEKILSDFNKTKRFGEATEIDVKALVDDSSGTVANMHRAFLIWDFNEEYSKTNPRDSQYHTYLKLFYKSQEKHLVALNGGKRSVNSGAVASLKEKFVEAVNSTPEIWSGLKDFFSGYVYGYFFNYLTEQTIMRDYADFLVCLGIMSDKVSSSASTKQKIMPKMGLLLNNDRFRYIGGEVPLQVMLGIVRNRFFGAFLEPEEETAFLNAIEDYMTENYPYHAADGLIADNVTETIMSKLASEYIRAADFAADLHKNTFDGVRTFLDGEKNDMGEYTVETVTRLVSEKCAANYDKFFLSGREPIIETGLQAECKGYKYPLVISDGDAYYFADIYKILLYPACDGNIYVNVEEKDLPLRLFPFADGALKRNIVRILGGIESEGYSVRTDKRDVLVEINSLPASKNLSEDDKKMMALEKLMYAISGNMDAVSYQKLLHEQVFTTQLFDDYIRYRFESVFSKGMKTLDAKKKLLNELNALSV